MIKKCFIPACPRQERPSGQTGAPGLTMNHTGDEATDRLFVCLLPRTPWRLIGICEHCGSATLSRRFGMGKLRDPCCDLRAELRPQGGVGLGRMEPWYQERGLCWLETRVAAESSRMEAVGASGRSRGCCDTPAPRTIIQWRLEDRPYWE